MGFGARIPCAKPIVIQTFDVVVTARELLLRQTCRRGWQPPERTEDNLQKARCYSSDDLVNRGRFGERTSNETIADFVCQSGHSGNAFAPELGNSLKYPGFSYDNLGRFVYVELKKKF